MTQLPVGIRALVVFLTGLSACGGATTIATIHCSWNGSFALVMADQTRYEGSLYSDPAYCAQPYFSKYDPNRLASGYGDPGDGSGMISIELRVTAEDGGHTLTVEPWVWRAEQDGTNMLMNHASYSGMLAVNYTPDTAALRVGRKGGAATATYYTSTGGGQASLLDGARWCHKPGDTEAVSFSLTDIALSDGALFSLSATQTGAMVAVEAAGDGG